MKDIIKNKNRIVSKLMMITVLLVLSVSCAHKTKSTHINKDNIKIEETDDGSEIQDEALRKLDWGLSSFKVVL